MTPRRILTLLLTTCILSSCGHVEPLRRRDIPPEAENCHRRTLSSKVWLYGFPLPLPFDTEKDHNWDFKSEERFDQFDAIYLTDITAEPLPPLDSGSISVGKHKLVRFEDGAWEIDGALNLAPHIQRVRDGYYRIPVTLRGKGTLPPKKVTIQYQMKVRACPRL